MPSPIVLPAGVQDSLDGNFRMFTLIELVLPAAQGGTYRWTTLGWDFDWQPPGGSAPVTWSRTNPFKFIDDSRTIPGEEGTVAMVLTDPKRLWLARIRSAGTRGHTVRIFWMVPLATWPADAWQMAGFSGKTQAVRPLRNQNSGGQETRVIAEDKMYYSRFDRGADTSDGYQRSLDPDDDSHVIAHTAIKLPLAKA